MIQLFYSCLLMYVYIIIYRAGLNNRYFFYGLKRRNTLGQFTQNVTNFFIHCLVRKLSDCLGKFIKLYYIIILEKKIMYIKINRKISNRKVNNYRMFKKKLRMKYRTNKTLKLINKKKCKNTNNLDKVFTIEPF